MNPTRFLIVLAALTCGCARAPEPRPAAPHNVLLVTIDTFRADRFGRGFTPAIDRLATSGRHFTNARTAVPLTLPSHVTLMTGALPLTHGVRENGVVFTPSTVGLVPLARALRDHGYATAAFVGAYVLDRRFGLSDGFDVYDDRVRRLPDGAASLEAERRGSEVADAAEGWLRSAAVPFFGWVHLYDPHAPYEPPQEFQARAGGRAYDGEIAYADAQVARVLEVVRSRGLERSTLIVVAGDHGEGLGDHGERLHGILAYDSTLRVPLVAAGAGLDRQVVTAPVSLADVGPSILARLGLKTIARDRGVVDLFSVVPADRDVYAETIYPRAAGWSAVATLAGERWKLVHSSEAELYDISADPGEQTNVAAEQPRILEGMRGRLQEIQTTAGSAQRAEAPSADVAERLRALGYVSGSGSRSGDAAGPNPARVIRDWTSFEDALTRVNEGKPREALPGLRELAGKFPDAALFQGTYARALKDAGSPSDALKVYKAAIARHLADASMFHDLAVAARAAGDLTEALRAEQAALALNATEPAALNGLGLLHVEAGRGQEAARAFERAAAADPSNASYWANLGNARRELGNAAGAEEAYRRALAADSMHADASNGLGVLLVQQRRAADAISWFERALQRAPDFHEARLNLGIAYQESRDTRKAAETYRRLLATAPPSAKRERQAAATLLKTLERKK